MYHLQSQAEEPAMHYHGGDKGHESRTKSGGYEDCSVEKNEFTLTVETG